MFCSRWPLLVFTPILLVGLASGRAFATDETPQISRLVNVDGTGITAKGTVSGGIDYRSVNKPEGIAYTSLDLAWGFTRSMELGVRGTTGTTTDFTAANSAI